MTERPFDDIRALINDLPTAPTLAADPALGRLGEIAAWVAAWRGKPELHRPIVALYAGSGGSDPRAVRAALEAVASGAAPVARMAQAAGAGVEAFDLAIDRPAPDMTRQASQTERECAATMAFGMEALAKQPDLLMPAILTDDPAAASAVALALYGGVAEDWADDQAPRAQAAALRIKVEAAGADPLEILRQLAGRQITAAFGAILAARIQGVPVLLDSYAVCAAAALLHAANPDALSHCLAAHASAQRGHLRLLQRLGMTPLLTLRLPGEGGAGALAGLQIVKAACAAA